MIDLKKHIETLIARAAESGQTTSAAMQYAQAAANAANAVATMDTIGMFRMPTEISETALEHLLDLARRSPTRSTPLPAKFNARIVPITAPDRPDFVPDADLRNVSP